MNYNNILNSKIILNDGTQIPILGLGTYDLQGKKALKAIEWALNANYRHFDSASFYQNEKEIGKAINSSEIPREDVFITTKVWASDLGYKQTKRAFENSLSNLNMPYIDLYLIHWPGYDEEKRLASWKAMQELVNENKIRSIGVSNYGQHELEEILEIFESKPSINQVHFSPFSFKKNILEFCQKIDVAVEAYTPLEKGRKGKNPILTQIAEKYAKTPAQIMIRWCIQHKVVVIPKSSNKDRIEENGNVFDFEMSMEDMKTLDNL